MTRSLALHIQAAKRARRVQRGRQHIEDDFHRSVATFLNVALPQDAWWTTFPAGGGGRVRGAQLKAKGLKPGVPDILIVRHGICHWLELKAPKGRASDDQNLCAVHLGLAGCPTIHTARSLQDVERALRHWDIGPLRARCAA